MDLSISKISYIIIQRCTGEYDKTCGNVYLAGK